MFQDDLPGLGILAAILLIGYLWLVWRGRGSRLRREPLRGPYRNPRREPGRRRSRRPVQIDLSRAIVVDGSNVMHWGGDPSFMVLNKVMDSLKRNGLLPIVYFDANVGYKLWNRHVDAAEMAHKLSLEENTVALSPSGVTADEVLLERAARDGLRVVSNDRFRDWQQKFPKVGQKGFLVRGRWQQGTVIWQGQLVRKPAAAL